jgi:hypothetical protein
VPSWFEIKVVSVPVWPEAGPAEPTLSEAGFYGPIIGQPIAFAFPAYCSLTMPEPWLDDDTFLLLAA